MRILQTQQKLESALKDGSACKEAHFHIVVCLEPDEVAPFMDALHRLVRIEKDMKDLTQGGEVSP